MYLTLSCRQSEFVSANAKQERVRVCFRFLYLVGVVASCVIFGNVGSP
jgi:hypothetical protein